MFRIGPYEKEAVLHICSNLRPQDERELACTNENFSPELLAIKCMLLKDFLAVAYDGGEPVAVIGTMKIHPTLWAAYMFATPRFPVIGLPMTRWTRRVYIPALRALGAKRIEARSIEGHTEAHRWMKAAGAKEECPVPCVGMGGENFVQFVYLWEEDSR